MIDPTTRTDPPHGPRAGPPESRRPSRRALAALVGVLLVVGPWPVDDSIGLGRGTFERLASSAPGASTGPIRVGLGEVDLSPPRPRPLAGFIGQIRTPFAGVDSRCYARALSIESGSGTITVLTADLLLIDARLARAALERSGLRADRVFFTASHTHGGPGGWGAHPLEMLVAGAYDPSYFETLAGQLAEAIRASRARLEPSEMGFVQVRAPGRQANRVDPSMPTHDALSALAFRPVGAGSGSPPTAVLAVFGAHATVSHPVPPRLGGDYPAALVDELRRRTGARSVLFASGAVGDASPIRPKARSSSRGAEALGRTLAGDLAAALPSARFSPEVEVASLRLEVDLPPVRLPFFGGRLRFSPALTWWIADRRTHLHALRLGPAVLVGFPGDYSGHLAESLAGSTRSTGLSSVATSFDGDFRGYLTSADVFRRRACYETRWMNFYGPRLGDELTDLARRMVERLATPATPIPAGGPGPVDPGPRLALAALLVAALAAALRGRAEAADLARRAGFLAVGVISAASLAFAIDPGLVDWAGVGLPAWARLLGLPLGAFALAGTTRRAPGRSALLLGSACALLASSWLVVLMLARGWVLSGLAGEPAEVTTGRSPAGARGAVGHQSK